jgi:uncharacterized membrane protein
VRTSRILQGLLVTGLALWVVGLWLAPATFFPIGRYICHQRPERSFFRHGQQLPVCARCTGLYIGAAIAAPLALALASSLASARARWIFGLAAAPTAVTWTLEFAGIARCSNLSRCMAALPLGFAAAWLVLSVLSGERR